jgi:carboxyl-terminal processing protease
MKSRKWLIGVIIVMAITIAFREPAERYFDIAKSLDIFATLFKEVNTYYVDEVDPEKLVKQGINGMLESLDPYTDFIPEEELDNFRITTTGQYAGIGALIGVVNNKTVITHPYENFPANKVGLHVGDELLAVDGVNVVGKSTAQISSLLKGQARTDVEVKIRRYGVNEPLLFKIRREKISLSNLAYAGILTGNVGYIKLDDFTPGAAREVSDAVMDLKRKGATKILLDLRNNPGGLMLEAVNIVSIFIPRGKEVVSTKGKVKDWNKTYSTLNNPVDTEIPLAVLINEGSASASEIVAGALQDYDRAVLVGNKTFGKGLVQTTRPLAYNTQLKVTTAKYYIPSGRCIQAIDYSHRNQDGSVKKFPDSLKREFKTASGRSVYDGAGIDPDVTIEGNYLGTVTVALLNTGFIFEYASKYVGENPQLPDLKNFKLTDTDYDKFLNWIKSQKFTYSTSLENSTRQLMETAKQERYYKEIEPQLSGLKKRIDEEKASDLIRFKQEIINLVEQQIAFHYKLNAGQALVSLPKDETINKAIEIISDSSSLKKLLTKK